MKLRGFLDELRQFYLCDTGQKLSGIATIFHEAMGTYNMIQKYLVTDSTPFEKLYTVKKTSSNPK